MASHGFIDSKRAQCILWTEKSFAYRTILRKYPTTYRKAALAPSRIVPWFEKYQIPGGHSHRGGPDPPKFDERKINRCHVQGKFYIVFAQCCCSKRGVQCKTILQFLQQDEEHDTYKPQIHQEAPISDKFDRNSVLQYWQKELIDDSECLKQIDFSNRCRLSASGIVNKQNCRILCSKNFATSISSAAELPIYYTLMYSTKKRSIWTLLRRKPKIHKREL